MDKRELEKTKVPVEVRILVPKKNIRLVGVEKCVTSQKNSRLRPPDWLSEHQKALWESAVIFAPPNQLQPVDASALNAWVVAQDLLRQAAIQLSNESLVITSPRTNREVPNPLVGIIAKQSALVLRAAAELGFSPSSRTRLQCGAENQTDADWDDF